MKSHSATVSSLDSSEAETNRICPSFLNKMPVSILQKAETPKRASNSLASIPSHARSDNKYSWNHFRTLSLKTKASICESEACSCSIRPKTHQLIPVERPTSYLPTFGSNSFLILTGSESTFVRRRSSGRLGICEILRWRWIP